MSELQSQPASAGLDGTVAGHDTTDAHVTRITVLHRNTGDTPTSNVHTPSPPSQHRDRVLGSSDSAELPASEDSVSIVTDSPRHASVTSQHRVSRHKEENKRLAAMEQRLVQRAVALAAERRRARRMDKNTRIGMLRQGVFVMKFLDNPSPDKNPIYGRVLCLDPQRKRLIWLRSINDVHKLNAKRRKKKKMFRSDRPASSVSIDPNDFIDVKDLVGCLYGHRSLNLRRIAGYPPYKDVMKELPAWKCFSIVTRNRTVDFYCHDVYAATNLILGVQSITGKPYFKWTYSSILSQRGRMKLRWEANNAQAPSIASFVNRKMIEHVYADYLEKHRVARSLFQPRKKEAAVELQQQTALISRLRTARMSVEEQFSFIRAALAMRQRQSGVVAIWKYKSDRDYDRQARKEAKRMRSLTSLPSLKIGASASQSTGETDVWGTRPHTSTYTQHRQRRATLPHRQPQSVEHGSLQVAAPTNAQPSIITPFHESTPSAPEGTFDDEKVHVATDGRTTNASAAAVSQPVGPVVRRYVPVLVSADPDEVATQAQTHASRATAATADTVTGGRADAQSGADAGAAHVSSAVHTARPSATVYSSSLSTRALTRLDAAGASSASSPRTKFSRVQVKSPTASTSPRSSAAASQVTYRMTTGSDNSTGAGSASTDANNVSSNTGRSAAHGAKSSVVQSSGASRGLSAVRHHGRRAVGTRVPRAVNYSLGGDAAIGVMDEPAPRDASVQSDSHSLNSSQRASTTTTATSTTTRVHLHRDPAEVARAPRNTQTAWSSSVVAPSASTVAPAVVPERSSHLDSSHPSTVRTANRISPWLQKTSAPASTAGLSSSTAGSHFSDNMHRESPLSGQITPVARTHTSPARVFSRVQADGKRTVQSVVGEEAKRASGLASSARAAPSANKTVMLPTVEDIGVPSSRLTFINRKYPAKPAGLHQSAPSVGSSQGSSGSWEYGATHSFAGSPSLLHLSSGRTGSVSLLRGSGANVLSPQLGVPLIPAPVGLGPVGPDSSMSPRANGGVLRESRPSERLSTKAPHWASIQELLRQNALLEQELNQYLGR